MSYCRLGDQAAASLAASSKPGKVVEQDFSMVEVRPSALEGSDRLQSRPLTPRPHPSDTLGGDGTHVEMGLMFDCAGLLAFG